LGRDTFIPSIECLENPSTDYPFIVALRGLENKFSRKIFTSRKIFWNFMQNSLIDSLKLTILSISDC
jgi:hypothetical protein